ncbi:Phage capsid family protein [Gemmata sp. SH-PL17]|uniref:phage major capsid protein n=1 Tax=Gemmata sp. SH-PL17 TaxID=1630693 RepID=UPI00078DB9CE|nr:phage major capsid protein [Gemmata sp. SH-PL17]AMV25509.1 Phage capsid family protein [Gemmata sp. SH-PL17]
MSALDEVKQELRNAKEELRRAQEVIKKGAMEPAEHTRLIADAITKSLPAQVRDPNADPYGFKNHAEFLSAVMKATNNPGVNMDRRLLPLWSGNVGKAESEFILKAVGSDEARTNSDPYGGFLLPTTYSPDFLKIDPENDPIGSRTRKVPMGSAIVKINARTDKNHTTSVSGGLTVTRRPDTVAATASQMQFEQVVLEAHDLFGLSYASENLLRDSPVTFTALLSAGFNDQFTYHLIKERLYGTGVGEFLGILTALDSGSLGPTVVVSKESGQLADTIRYENVLNMRARCWGYSKAVWLANHDTMPQLMLLNQAVGTGGQPMWQPSAREDHPDMLLGRPLFFTEYAKTLGDSGDLILSNWEEYLEGTFQPMQSEESIHVRFVNHERAFKFYMRNAGMPWWKVALTPTYSANKLSPFVVLEAR